MSAQMLGNRFQNTLVKFRLTGVSQEKISSVPLRDLVKQFFCLYLYVYNFFELNPLNPQKQAHFQLVEMSLAKFFTLLRVVTVALCVAMFLALMVEVWKQVRLSSMQMLATMTLWKHQLPLKY